LAGKENFMIVKRNICNFTDLLAWQKNQNLVLRIYKITKKFPKTEIFGLTSQIRRSASSITANIAEGYGRFHYRDKMRFYYQARGSNTETQNHLILARDLNYLDKKEFEELVDLAKEGYKLLCGLIKSTEIN
jgi:four helix bundle protein